MLPIHMSPFRLPPLPDDLLIMVGSPELAIHRMALLEYMQYMGLTINWRKSAPWPASYLGLSLDAVSMTATITHERWAATQETPEECIPGGKMK